MNHPTEDQLILHHYGEDSGGIEVAAHLDTCESCRANYHALQRVLAAIETLPVPERAESYGAEVWRLVRPQLAKPARTREPDSWRLFPWPRWAFAAALGSLVLGAFLAGRFWSHPPTNSAPAIAQSQPLSTGARERVLLTEIGDHLERSQLALIELINGKTNGAVDITAEQVLARELASVNRLFRRAATDAGEPGLASVLEELERVLVEVANGPARLSADEFAALRERIDTDGLLFKVKVLGAQVRSRERDAARELAANRS
jgi:hypothetical protein